MRVLFLCFVMIFASCSQRLSDEEIETELKSKMRAAAAGVVASVHDGVVTLSGTCPDESCRHTSETAARQTKGVKQVVNNIIISTPPAPASTLQTPSADTLKK